MRQQATYLGEGNETKTFNFTPYINKKTPHKLKIGYNTKIMKEI